MPSLIKPCLLCNTEFDPGKTRRRYCSDKCYNRAKNARRAKPETLKDRLIAYLGSRACTNCRSTTKGPRYVFFWDYYDRQEENLEVGNLLCYPCFFRFNKVRATQDRRFEDYDRAGEPRPFLIPM